MSLIERIVIVGAGLAGARAAETLRKDGFDGTITLVGDEPERPYLRPPLSKEYLSGEVDLDRVFVHKEPFYDEHRIDLRRSASVTALDLADQAVVLADGHRLPFDRLLLATGARPHKLRLAGADLPGVLNLRTLADADAIRMAVADAERIVVVGGGWIGSEVAASLRVLGREVVLIAPREVPLSRVLGAEMGGVYRDLHVEHGVDLRMGTRLSQIVGAKRVEAVETADGERIAAQLVIVGVGVEPRTELAKAAGLSVGDGVEVSAALETSVPGIFAAGDLAAAWHPFYGERIRVEHWANARFQGAAAGHSMLGADVSFDQIPYFYSDQYDLGVEYTGYAVRWDRLVVRGSLADRRFIAFWLADGRVVAGMNANIRDVAEPIQRLIRSRAIVDVDALADPAMPLHEIAGVADAV